MPTEMNDRIHRMTASEQIVDCGHEEGKSVSKFSPCWISLPQLTQDDQDDVERTNEWQTGFTMPADVQCSTTVVVSRLHGSGLLRIPNVRKSTCLSKQPQIEGELFQLHLHATVISEPGIMNIFGYFPIPRWIKSQHVGDSKKYFFVASPTWPGMTPTCCPQHPPQLLSVSSKNSESVLCSSIVRSNHQESSCLLLLASFWLPEISLPLLMNTFLFLSGTEEICRDANAVAKRLLIFCLTVATTEEQQRNGKRSLWRNQEWIVLDWVSALSSKGISITMCFYPIPDTYLTEPLWQLVSRCCESRVCFTTLTTYLLQKLRKSIGAYFI